MKNFLKGVAAVAIVMIISMAIHMFCNMKGINLNTTMTTIVSASFATLIYHVLTNNEKKKDNKELQKITDTDCAGIGRGRS